MGVEGLTPDWTEILERVRDAFGSGCELAGIERVHRGGRKQLYFLRLHNPNDRCVMYVWDRQAAYFADREEAGFEDKITDEAPALFNVNTRFLLDHGVHVPSVIHRGTLDSGPEFAFVEEIKGVHWGTYAARASSAERAETLGRIRDQVSRLHSIRRSTRGSPVQLAGGLPPSIERTADRTMRELNTLAATDPNVRRERERIAARVGELREEITPRSEFTLVHGELPHHILVRDHDREVYLVDIEDVRFFDIEVDHVQFKLWWSETDYGILARDDLDPARMAFYTFSWHVSCAYAGSGLLKGEFPDQRLALDIYEYNVHKALATL